MRSTHVLSRSAWVHRVLGPSLNFTPRACERTWTELVARHWHTAAPPHGRAWERIAFVVSSSRFAALVEPFSQARTTHGSELWFPIASVEGVLQASIRTRPGAGSLASLGLGIAACTDEQVLLRPIDVRAARYVNMARVGPPVGEVSVRGLIAAFLCLGNPARRRVQITDDRRLDTLIALDEWGIDAPDLFEQRQRVAICSRWHLPAAPVVAVPAPAATDECAPALASTVLKLRRIGSGGRLDVVDL
jgi:hypothetical protein